MCTTDDVGLAPASVDVSAGGEHVADGRRLDDIAMRASHEGISRLVPQAKIAPSGLEDEPFVDQSSREYRPMNGVPTNAMKSDVSRDIGGLLYSLQPRAAGAQRPRRGNGTSVNPSPQPGGGGPAAIPPITWCGSAWLISLHVKAWLAEDRKRVGDDPIKLLELAQAA